MNVNLSSAYASAGNYPRQSIAEQMDQSREILAQHEDTNPIGPPVLIPEIQGEYPGSYQVWFPVRDGWLHVTADGVMVHIDTLPEFEHFMDGE